MSRCLVGLRRMYEHLQAGAGSDDEGAAGDCANLMLEQLPAIIAALERAERVEVAARDLDGTIVAHWIGRSELRYAEGRLWAALNDARERLRMALDEGGGAACMTPGDVAYALEEHARVMQAVRALERSLQDYDIAGDDVLAEERDLFIAAGVWPREAREIGRPGAPPTPDEEEA